MKGIHLWSKLRLVENMICRNSLKIKWKRYMLKKKVESEATWRGTTCKGWEEKISSAGWLRACRFGSWSRAYLEEEMRNNASKGQIVGGTLRPSSGSSLFWCIVEGGNWSRTDGVLKVSPVNAAFVAVWCGWGSGGGQSWGVALGEAGVKGTGKKKEKTDPLAPKAYERMTC